MDATSHRIKLSHFKNIVAVAAADGGMDEEENRYLIEKAHEYGLLSEEVAALVSQSGKLAQIVPENDVDREEQLADAVYIAMVNGKMSPDEYDLCVRIARKLQFTPDDVDELMQLIENLWRNRIR